MQEHVQQQKEYSFYDLFNPVTTKKAVIIFIIIGIIVFFNSLFNPFQGDDYAQIVNNPFVGHVNSIFSFFLRGMALPGSDFSKVLHLQYRPILYATYILLYSLFGNTTFPYHLLQLILQIANTVLVFFLFSKFIKKELAFVLSLIFLVHPINAETVIYISDLQDAFFVFFGLTALNTILKKEKTHLSDKRLFFVALMLLCSILSKETGILFIGIIFLYGLLFNKENFKRIGLTTVIVSVGYIVLRYIVSFASTVDIGSSLLRQTPLAVRLITIPKIIFYYLSTFVFPIHLEVGQLWLVRQINFSDFTLPLLIDSIFVVCLIACGIFVIYNKKKYFKEYFFFALWFCLGLIVHLQLIPLDATVADRFFYFPIIGLLGMIGVIFKMLNFPTNTKPIQMQYAVLLSCIVIVVFSILTIIRNSEWQTVIGLFSHDAQYAQDPQIDSYYGGMLLLNGQFDEAKPYLEESIKIDPNLGYNFNNLAVYYEHEKNYSKAAELYSENIQHNKNEFNTYIDVSYTGLAHIALNERKFERAKLLSEVALKMNPSNTYAQQYLAISAYELGEKTDSLSTISKLYKQSPNAENQGLLNLIETNKLPFPVLQDNGDVIY